MSTHEVVAIDEDRHRKVSVESGDRLANIVYDCSAPGAAVTIETTGTGWELRHLAVAGHNDTDEPALDVSDRANGHSIIENVWLSSGGDGAGIRVDRRHSGEITIARTRVEGFAPGFDSHRPLFRANGTVTYDRCYAAGCYHANYLTGDDTLTDSVADPADGTYSGRGVWAHGDTLIRDSDIGASSANAPAIHAGAAGRTVTVTLEDTAYDPDGGLFTDSDSTINELNTSHNPSLSLPVGAPLTEPHAYGGDTETVGDSTSPLRERDFDTIEVGHDEHYTVGIGANESLENTIFDLSNNGAAATIYADGPGWELRNIAFEGAEDRPDTSPHYAIIASTPAGQSSTIENVYMGDGSAVGPDDVDGRGRAAMYVRPSHAGSLTIRRASIANWPGGGIVTEPETPGDIHAESCYFRNCGYETLTLPTQSSSADDCVFANYRPATPPE